MLQNLSGEIVTSGETLPFEMQHYFFLINSFSLIQVGINQSERFRIFMKDSDFYILLLLNFCFHFFIENLCKLYFPFFQIGSKFRTRCLTQVSEKNFFSVIFIFWINLLRFWNTYFKNLIKMYFFLKWHSYEVMLWSGSSLKWHVVTQIEEGGLENVQSDLNIVASKYFIERWQIEWLNISKISRLCFFFNSKYF